MKKIVTIPVFCESHLVKYQIPNIIDTINPDIIIYNEGMFPSGTEGTKKIDEDWIKKYTLNGEGKRGFDYEDLKSIITDAQEKYPDVNIILNEIDYSDCIDKGEYDFVGTKCYVKANSNFKELGIELEEGDFIFPLEGDTFYHQDSKIEIQGYLDQLKPDSGIKSVVVDFIQNQYYTECVNWLPYNDLSETDAMNPFTKSRRFCVCYGTEDFYHSVLSDFMTQNYDMLFPTDLITYHYAWWRPGKFLELRCDQLERTDEKWSAYLSGMEQASTADKELVVVRPWFENNNPRKFLKKINLDHPKHIVNHPNYLKEGK
tara:strand:+ start:1746 stop:2693 length:948 start_codon:yes stop_codon:yes gene_type:complete